jgi:Type IIA topoisomerase (DNA gyrase/topo II, topoisomerase IV), A subunit
MVVGTKEDDFIDKIFITNTHNYILYFSNHKHIY